MIPDIAFMIVVYGCARLLVAALEPTRTKSGMAGQLATAFTWVIAVFAIGGLGLLAFAVAGSSASLSDLTK